MRSTLFQLTLIWLLFLLLQVIIIKIMIKKPSMLFFLIYCFYFLTSILQSRLYWRQSRHCYVLHKQWLILLGGRIEKQRQNEVPIFIYLFKSRGKGRNFLIPIVNVYLLFISKWRSGFLLINYKSVFVWFCFIYFPNVWSWHLPMTSRCTMFSVLCWWVLRNAFISVRKGELSEDTAPD